MSNFNVKIWSVTKDKRSTTQNLESCRYDARNFFFLCKKLKLYIHIIYLFIYL